MEIPFELQIALRYLLAKRKQAFISVISAISILGVTVGVMALVIALALMTGLQQEVRDRILGSNPHMFVWKTSGITDYDAEARKLKQVPDVTGAAPGILGRALITSGSSEAFTASMFQSELSTPEEKGHFPLTMKPSFVFLPRPAASAIDEAISTSGLASHSSCCVSGS